MGAQDKDVPEGKGKVTTTVVAPTPKRKLSKIQKLILLGVVLVLLVVAGVLVWRSTHGPKQAASTKKPAQTQQQKYQSLQDQTAQLERDQKYSDQARAIEAYLRSNPPQQEKAEQTYKLAASYINAKEYQNAIDLLKTLPDMDKSYTVDAYHGMALAYMRLGDNKTAVEMYKKAIAALKADNDPANNSQQIAMDEQAVKMLGGTL
jgi:Tfp pilus assembly protein PilF